MTLTKADIAESLTESAALNKRDAKEMVELVFELIKGALENGERVKISGFGNFELRDKAARPGRNPKTGEVVQIAPRRVVTFKAGQNLKAQVDEFHGELEEK